MDPPTVHIESRLLDLTTLSLEDLRTREDAELAFQVTRLLTRLDDPDRRIGGHNPQSRLD
jgi:hypothetical protein